MQLRGLQGQWLHRRVTRVANPSAILCNTIHPIVVVLAGYIESGEGGEASVKTRAPTSGRKVGLRLLATSDLHMQIASYNYVRDEPDTSGSLAKIATLIADARREAEHEGQLCLLMDNGDTLQGGPMAEFLAGQKTRMPNPMIACMNHLRYDCGGLGNHDCDFGLDYLNRCLMQHEMPVVCSNIRAEKLRCVQDEVLLEREARTSDDETVTLRIGVLSSLPDKTAAWNRHHLTGLATLSDPIEALRRRAAALRGKGADLIVVLAHMGLSIFDEGPETQNRIAEVSALEDVDVVVGGHTHLRFPGPDHEDLENVDAARGLVHGTPVVQPGASGEDLGQIDLQLRQGSRQEKWNVADVTIRLLPVGPKTEQDPQVACLARAAHEATRTYLRQPAGHIAKPKHSYFALAQPNPVIALVAAAKERVIANAVAGTSLADLPLLSACSAKLSGGYHGPDNFICLTGGLIELRHIAGLNPYANQVWAVRANGARVLEWLERSTVIFNTLHPEAPEQLLINPQVPGFRYDFVFGLEYVVDLRRPAKFDVAGRPIPGNSGRITQVTWQGKPLDPEQEFLVATSDHRVGGGGLYRPFSFDEIMLDGESPLRRALVDYLKAPDCAAVRSARPWRFAQDMRRQAILLTSPDAVNYLNDIAALSPETCGVTKDGFLRVRLDL